MQREPSFAILTKLDGDDELPEYTSPLNNFLTECPLKLYPNPRTPYNSSPRPPPSFKCQEPTWAPTTTTVQYPPHSKLLTSIGNSASHNQLIKELLKLTCKISSRKFAEIQTNLGCIDTNAFLYLTHSNQPKCYLIVYFKGFTFSGL